MSSRWFYAFVLLLGACGSQPDAISRDAATTAPRAPADVPTQSSFSTTVDADVDQAARDDTPEGVTGLKIGDRIDPNQLPAGYRSDGTFDVSQVPKWTAVGRDSVVVGYVLSADLFGLPTSPSDPPIGKDVPVYDSSGVDQIGVLGANGVVLSDQP